MTVCGGVRYVPPPKVEIIKQKKPRRSLTISSNRKRQKINKQARCLFLQGLPLEIRRLIYQEVVKSWGWSERVHVVEKRPGWDLQPIRCLSCRFATDEGVDHAVLAARTSDSVPSIQYFRNQHKKCCESRNDVLNLRYLSIFLSCRIM